MKRFFSIIAIIAMCASASAQTVKPLAYNMTNGTVMVSTNVTWSNSFKFSTNTVAAQVRTNLLLPAAWLTNTNTGTFRSDIGFSTNIDALWTATNSAGARNAINLSAAWLTNTNSPLFPDNSGQVAWSIEDTNNANEVFGVYITPGQGTAAIGTIYGPNLYSEWFSASTYSGPITVSRPIEFSSANGAQTRTNIGLSLPALTNTSNVTMMRALSGTTNTNHPYSGSISVVGTNNTNTLTFSNGILQSVQ